MGLTDGVESTSGAPLGHRSLTGRQDDMDRVRNDDIRDAATGEEPAILEEIEVEDLAVDGICGVY